MGRVWSICQAAWKGHPLCHSHWALHFLSLVGSGCSPLNCREHGGWRQGRDAGFQKPLALLLFS